MSGYCPQQCPYIIICLYVSSSWQVTLKPSGFFFLLRSLKIPSFLLPVQNQTALLFLFILPLLLCHVLSAPVKVIMYVSCCQAGPLGSAFVGCIDIHEFNHIEIGFGNHSRKNISMPILQLSVLIIFNRYINSRTNEHLFYYGSFNLLI